MYVTKSVRRSSPQILDELIVAGEMQESSKKSVLRVVTQSDAVEESENGEDVRGQSTVVDADRRRLRESAAGLAKRHTVMLCAYSWLTSGACQATVEYMYNT